MINKEKSAIADMKVSFFTVMGEMFIKMDIDSIYIYIILLIQGAVVVWWLENWTTGLIRVNRS